MLNRNDILDLCIREKLCEINPDFNKIKRKYGEYRNWRFVRKAVKLDFQGRRPNPLAVLMPKHKPAAQDESR